MRITNHSVSRRRMSTSAMVVVIVIIITLLLLPQDVVMDVGTIIPLPVVQAWIQIQHRCSSSSRIRHESGRRKIDRGTSIQYGVVHLTQQRCTRTTIPHISRPLASTTTSTTSSSSSSTTLSSSSSSTTTTTTTSQPEIALFNEFVEFLIQQQTSIINDIETTIETESGQTFTRDGWGIFSTTTDGDVVSQQYGSGGITRVLQQGTAIEKGACSLTVIRDGILSAERALSIRGRQPDSSMTIQAGDTYSAVALSMVLHSRNPMVPTFRSDVRMFQVVVQQGHNNTTNVVTWLGGGADLTPYYLYRTDVQDFHQMYHDLCQKYNKNDDTSSSSSLLNYTGMKQACDSYFYLPARQEHRGTGGIFFDDIPVHRIQEEHTMSSSSNTESTWTTTVPNNDVLAFGQEMTQTWMPSWIPIVQRRNALSYTPSERHWQKLRRGRYLEFNLLYDVSQINVVVDMYRGVCIVVVWCMKRVCVSSMLFHLIDIYVSVFYLLRMMICQILHFLFLCA